MVTTSRKKLRQQIKAVEPILKKALEEKKDSKVIIGNVEISEVEAKLMLEEFEKISDETLEINFEVIPMKLVATNYLFREIQISLNELS